MIGRPVGCYGKKIFTSYWAAARAAKNLNKFEQSAHANSYRCPNCHFYHVGNSMGKLKHNRHSRHTNKEEFNHVRSNLSE
jgi:hypothetical protein